MQAIWVDPEIMSGTPCFRGTRVPVRNLFDYIEGNHSIDEFLESFPSVKRDQVEAVLELARQKILESVYAA